MIENQSTPQNFPFQQFPERACNFCFSTIKFKSTTWEKDVVIGPWQHRTRTFNSFENYFQLIYYKLDHSSLTTWGDFKHKLVRLETDPGKWISPKKKVMQPLLSGEITSCSESAETRSKLLATIWIAALLGKNYWHCLDYNCSDVFTKNYISPAHFSYYSVWCGTQKGNVTM